MAKNPLSAHFYFESGHAETLDFTGFAGFVAKNPLLFYTLREKVKLYNNIRKKVGI